MENEVKVVDYEELRSMYFRKEQEVKRLQNRIEVLEEEVSKWQYKALTRS